MLFLDKKVEDLYYSLSEKKSKIYIERSVVSTEMFSKSLRASTHNLDDKKEFDVSSEGLLSGIS